VGGPSSKALLRIGDRSSLLTYSLLIFFISNFTVRILFEGQYLLEPGVPLLHTYWKGEVIHSDEPVPENHKLWRKRGSRVVGK